MKDQIELILAGEKDPKRAAEMIAALLSQMLEPYKDIGVLHARVQQLKQAKAKAQILLKEVETQIAQADLDKKPIRKEQAVSWLAAEDAIEALHKLREAFGV